MTFDIKVTPDNPKNLFPVAQRERPTPISNHIMTPFRRIYYGRRPDIGHISASAAAISQISDLLPRDTPGLLYSDDHRYMAQDFESVAELRKALQGAYPQDKILVVPVSTLVKVFGENVLTGLVHAPHGRFEDAKTLGSAVLRSENSERKQEILKQHVILSANSDVLTALGIHLEAQTTDSLPVKDEAAEIGTEIKVLGEGHFTKVSEVVTPNGDHVAVKSLKPWAARDAHAKQLIESERRVLEEAQRRHVTAIVQLAEQQGKNTLATEVLTGATVEAQEKMDLTSQQRLNLVRDVVYAVLSSHRGGIIHRDLKAENILRRNNGVLVLVDLAYGKVLPQTSSNQLIDSLCDRDGKEDWANAGRTIYEILAKGEDRLPADINEALERLTYSKYLIPQGDLAMSYYDILYSLRSLIRGDLRDLRTIMIKTGVPEIIGMDAKLQDSFQAAELLYDPIKALWQMVETDTSISNLERLIIKEDMLGGISGAVIAVLKKRATLLDVEALIEGRDKDRSIKSKLETVRVPTLIGERGNSTLIVPGYINIAKSTIVSRLAETTPSEEEREKRASTMLKDAVRACVKAYEAGVSVDRIIRAIDTIDAKPAVKYIPAEDKELVAFLAKQSPSLNPLDKNIVSQFNYS